jgi:hypothetical protein
VFPLDVDASSVIESKGVLNNEDVHVQICPGEVTHQRLRVGSKKSSSKAAAILTRGAYAEYVSTEKWRERRWRLFSTDPQNKPVSEGTIPFLTGR